MKRKHMIRIVAFLGVLAIVAGALLPALASR